MSERGPLVIVNPSAGGGRTGRTISEISAVAGRRLGRMDIVLTEERGHAIDLAREGVRDGRRLLVAVGGDGTLHEVVNGVLDEGGDAAVGYLGQGTGGDFRRTLGIRHRLDAYVDAIASGRERRLDAGKLRYRDADGKTRTRWFINILSAGLSGLVDHYIGSTTKILGGTAAYFLASARALAGSQRARLRCDVGLAGERHERRVDTFMIAICNGRYFGGGMHVAPMAKPDDGRFDVVSIDAPSRLAFAAFSARIYGGKHLSAPGAQHFACDRISLELETERARGAFLLDVDGEALGGLPLDVEIVPAALRMRS